MRCYASIAARDLTVLEANSRETILSFVDAINARDIEALAQLMTDDHKFVDAHGNEVAGREQMIGGWRGYFEWFPDYRIEVKQIFEHGHEFALFGCAGGSFKGNPERSWWLPAAWRVVVRDDQVALWQVYADTKIPWEAIERKNFSFTPPL